jgi:5-methylcytosine-specific restriction endonuclease McrA
MTDLHLAAKKLLGILQKSDQQIATLATKAEVIKAKYDPVKVARSEFKNWRQSFDGKNWKKEKFKSIHGVCPVCSQKFNNARHFDIDHIKPLSKYPELALLKGNLQLLCHACNLQKGDTV